MLSVLAGACRTWLAVATDGPATVTATDSTVVRTTAAPFRVSCARKLGQRLVTHRELIFATKAEQKCSKDDRAHRKDSYGGDNRLSLRLLRARCTGVRVDIWLAAEINALRWVWRRALVSLAQKSHPAECAGGGLPFNYIELL
jgi:hypothetical protein